MCLIAFAWKSHPRLPLVLAANRDELHARPAAAADYLREHPGVYGGRDLQAGGGWLMSSRKGRLAAVTNVRAGPGADPKPRSRGDLVRGFAAGAATAGDFARALAATAMEHGRFNLLLWDGSDLHFATNHPAFATAPVVPGLHAMSNGAFDARWPKATHATRALQAWLDAHEPADATPAGIEPLFAALADRERAPDELLPDTGVGIELERALSPAFIRDPVYGTRCSSVVMVDADGGIAFAERRFDAQGITTGTSFQRL